MPTNSLTRCAWVGDDELYRDYHDLEWGVPLHDERRLFEMLILEGAQAGLSWITILRKRKNYRATFDNFDAAKIAKYDEAKVAELLQNPGIIRNKLKIRAAITNAQIYMNMRENGETLDEYFWEFVDGAPIQNNFSQLSDIPAQTELSQQISADMKRKGFKFVGPTIVYAHMQSIGMVNDHTTDCFRFTQLKR